MRLALGQPAPAFCLAGVDGREHALADYADADVLVLIQSCNHCPYVLAWEGRMVTLQGGYAARGVRLVAFNSNDAGRYPEDSFEQMVKHASAAGYNFDYLHDPAQALARALGAERTPEAFLFDRDRRLAYHGAIDDNRDDTKVAKHYLREAIEATLAGETPRCATRHRWGAPSSGFPDRIGPGREARSTDLFCASRNRGMIGPRCGTRPSACSSSPH